MSATRITYADGTTIDIHRVVPSAYLDVEEELGQPIEGKLNTLPIFSRLVHATLTLREGERRSFREWLDQVDEISDVADVDASEATAEVPTSGEEQSPGESPT